MPSQPHTTVRTNPVPPADSVHLMTAELLALPLPERHKAVAELRDAHLAVAAFYTRWLEGMRRTATDDGLSERKAAAMLEVSPSTVRKAAAKRVPRQAREA